MVRAGRVLAGRVLKERRRVRSPSHRPSKGSCSSQPPKGRRGTRIVPTRSACAPIVTNLSRGDHRSLGAKLACSLSLPLRRNCGVEGFDDSGRRTAAARIPLERRAAGGVGAGNRRPVGARWVRDKAAGGAYASAGGRHHVHPSTPRGGRPSSPIAGRRPSRLSSRLRGGPGSGPGPKGRPSLDLRPQPPRGGSPLGYPCGRVCGASRRDVVPLPGRGVTESLVLARCESVAR